MHTCTWASSTRALLYHNINKQRKAKNQRIVGKPAVAGENRRKCLKKKNQARNLLELPAKYHVLPILECRLIGGPCLIFVFALFAGHGLNLNLRKKKPEKKGNRTHVSILHRSGKHPARARSWLIRPSTRTALSERAASFDIRLGRARSTGSLSSQTVR